MWRNSRARGIGVVCAIAEAVGNYHFVSKILWCDDAKEIFFKGGLVRSLRYQISRKL